MFYLIVKSYILFIVHYYLYLKIKILNLVFKLRSIYIGKQANFRYICSFKFQVRPTNPGYSSIRSSVKLHLILLEWFHPSGAFQKKELEKIGKKVLHHTVDILVNKNVILYKHFLSNISSQKPFFPNDLQLLPDFLTLLATVWALSRPALEGSRVLITQKEELRLPEHHSREED